MNEWAGRVYGVMFFRQVLAFCFIFSRPGRFIGESANFVSNWAGDNFRISFRSRFLISG